MKITIIVSFLITSSWAAPTDLGEIDKSLKIEDSIPVAFLLVLPLPISGLEGAIKAGNGPSIFEEKLKTSQLLSSSEDHTCSNKELDKNDQEKFSALENSINDVMPIILNFSPKTSLKESESLYKTDSLDIMTAVVAPKYLEMDLIDVLKPVDLEENGRSRRKADWVKNGAAHYKVSDDYPELRTGNHYHVSKDYPKPNMIKVTS